MPENKKHLPDEIKPIIEDSPNVVEVISERATVNAGGSGNKFLAISIIVAALLVSGTLVYLFSPGRANVGQTGGEASSTAAVMPNFPTSLPYPQTRKGNEVILGNPNAPVQMIEYGDYQCTYCNAYFNQTEPLIRQNYVADGKVSEVFKNLVVIDNFVPGGHESFDSALAASCAMDQNKFWEYHDAIYTFKTVNPGENAGNLTRDVFIQIATKLGMDVNQFTSCLDSQKYSDLITSDIKDASASFKRLATPSFLINGQSIQGAYPYNVFQQVIDAALKKAGQ